MSDEILINACESDEVVIYDEDGSEELLLSAEGIVILSADAPVDSVNGQTGVIVLGAADVGADPAGAAAAIGTSKANAVHSHAITDVVGLAVALAQVEANRLEILSKADQTALSALALLVDTKVDQSVVAQQIAELVGTDAQVLAAITALGEALADDQDLLDALEYTVANRVRFDVNNQSLTGLQKSNARTNISAEEVGVAALLIAQITAASIGAATATQGAKADAALAAIDTPAAVRDTTLTGLSTATAVPVTATDTVLVAAGKLQAQVAAQRPLPRVPYVAGRFYGNNPFGTPFSASVVAALQRRTAFFEPHFDMTIDQIGLVVTVAPPSAAKVWLAVYEMDAATSSQLNLLHTFAEIAVDATVGAKMTGASYTFQQGRTYVFVHYSDTALNIRNVSVYAGLSIGLTSADATAPSTFFYDNGTPYTAPPATINTTAMTMAGSNPTLIVMRAA